MLCTIRTLSIQQWVTYLSVIIINTNINYTHKSFEFIKEKFQLVVGKCSWRANWPLEHTNYLDDKSKSSNHDDTYGCQKNPNGHTFFHSNGTERWKF